MSRRLLPRASCLGVISAGILPVTGRGPLLKALTLRTPTLLCARAQGAPAARKMPLAELGWCFSERRSVPTGGGQSAVGGTPTVSAADERQSLSVPRRVRC